MLILRDILDFYYPINFLFSLFLNLFLIYHIVFKSPKKFKFLKWILVQSSTFQILLSIASVFLQIRVIPSFPIEIRSYGICRNFKACYCYFTYLLYQTIGGAVGASLCYTFYYKYYSVKTLSNAKNWKYIKAYFLIFTPACISATCAIIIIIRDNEIFEYLDSTNNETSNKVIGYSRNNTAPNLINSIHIAVTTLGVPIVCMYYRKKIGKTAMKSMSVKSFDHTKSFMRGLTIQALFPLVLGLPIMALHYYCLITGYQSDIHQYLLTPFLCFPTLFDPCINLYFIKPYRKSILKMFGKKYKPSVTQVNSVFGSIQWKWN